MEALLDISGEGEHERAEAALCIAIGQDLKLLTPHRRVRGQAGQQHEAGG